MFCNNCGKQFADEEMFCGGCGLNVEPVSANDGKVVARWKKMKAGPRILLGGAVGCGGCLLLILMFNLIGSIIGIIVRGILGWFW